MPKTQSVIALDLLRGLAALEVFLEHLRGASFVEYGALPLAQKNPLVAALFGLTRLGHEAVLVFFVLSGYLVCGQLISRAREGRFDVRDYATDRVTRIFLPLIPACLLTVAFDRLFFGTPIDLYQLIFNMAGLNGILAETLRLNPALWTLAYEIWFYIIGGAAAYLFCVRKPQTLVLLIVIGSIGAFSVLEARYLLIWIMGGMLVLLDQKAPNYGLALGGACLALVGVTLWQLSMQSQSFTNATYLPAGITELLICAGVALIIPFATTPKFNSYLGFLRKPSQYLSAVSFSLYLFHSPINSVLDLFIPKFSTLSLISFAAFLTRVVLTLLVVTFLYMLFERNTGALRRHFRASSTVRVTP